MINEVGQPDIENQKAAARALIERLQPGEMLQVGERAVAQYFLGRMTPGSTREHEKYIEQFGRILRL